MSQALTRDLLSKIRVLGETVWSGAKITETQIQAWLNNFTGELLSTDQERLHALFVLSHFMYFDLNQFRELLRVVYRDLYRYPLVQLARKQHRNSLDASAIEKTVDAEEHATRFIGLGSPSESGSLLLYFFRQENNIPVARFIHGHQVFTRYGDPTKVAVRDAAIKHYVFVDDLCGSGDQVVEYSEDIVAPLKSRAPHVSVSYFSLFATSAGLKRARNETGFDRIETVFELDESFQCFTPQSRLFASHPSDIDPGKAQNIFMHYGMKLFPRDPLGHKNGQLLLGFWHNTPDNTLPTIWYKGKVKWTPIFDRYRKI